ncbi:hypothetical protein [Elizabethkingia meningoseptica]|uniref:hypothetical protein n=1 Tax=Elizabethkingia meningoseptica TaxID=238 RepID=UPI003891F291
MRKIHNIFNITFALIIIIAIIACKEEKYTGKNSIETVKYNNNATTFSPIELDSVQTINNITALKLQEVYDLATNYAAGNKDSDIDITLYNQIQEYFEKPDSAKIHPFIKELDSLKARFVKINDVTTFKHVTSKDTLDYAKYKMDYYNKDRKYLGYQNKEVHYVMKEVPAIEKKFKREFKFYFVDFRGPARKDSILSGKAK